MWYSYFYNRQTNKKTLSHEVYFFTRPFISLSLVALIFCFGNVSSLYHSLVMWKKDQKHVLCSSLFYIIRTFFGYLSLVASDTSTQTLLREHKNRELRHSQTNTETQTYKHRCKCNFCFYSRGPVGQCYLWGLLVKSHVGLYLLETGKGHLMHFGIILKAAILSFIFFRSLFWRHPHFC